jgi:hypothetical protein
LMRSDQAVAGGKIALITPASGKPSLSPRVKKLCARRPVLGHSGWREGCIHFSTLSFVSILVLIGFACQYGFETLSVGHE